ncbi:MAG TPA: hypothetical protein PLC54_00155 [Spirochaetales bacterium]|nr:hypothetical protein [Spirochaetales bacterium]
MLLIDTQRHRAFWRKTWLRLLATVLVFPGINLALNHLIVLTEIPLFLDSIFTAMAACLGWPYGLATAFMTNFYAELMYGFPWRHLPFALCGMATAVIVFRMIRMGKFSTPLNFVAATLLVAFANSLLGAIIATLVFGGGTATNIDVIVMGFALIFDNIFSAAFLGRFVVNLVDKAPAVLAAMYFWRYLGPFPGRPLLDTDEAASAERGQL